MNKILLLLCCFCFFESAVRAEDKINEKARKYYKILKKRPTGGYLFTRFYNAWLDTGNLKDLEAFLVAENNSAARTTADGLILGFFHARQGEDGQALQVFTDTLKKDPDNAEAWLEKAKLSSRALDFETALKDIDLAVSKTSKRDIKLEANKIKGRLLIRSGNNEAALALWKALLDQNAENEDLYEDLIETQIEEGLYDEAVATSIKLVTKTTDPYLKVLRQLRTGDIYQRLRKREDALKVYRESLVSTGSGSWIEKEILSQIEQVFRREDDISGLSVFLKKLCDTETQRPNIAQRHAEVLMEQGDEKQAITQFEKLLAKTPGERSLREAFIDILTQAKEFTKAVQQTETLFEQNKEDTELLVRLANLLHQNNQTDEAEATLTRYLRLTKGAEYASLRVARLLEGYGKIDQAEAVFREFLKNDSDSLNVRETFAAFLHRNNQKQKAVEIWEGVAKQGNRDQVVRMARTLMSRQELESAYKTLQARYEEFKNDRVFLGQLCVVAIRLEKFNEAVDWSYRRVAMVENPVDLEEAVKGAAKVVSNSDQAKGFTNDLKNKNSLTDLDRCLLAELSELGGDFEQTDNYLNVPQETDIILSQKIRILRLRQDWKSAAESTRKLVERSEGRKSTFLRDLVELYRRAGLIDEAKKTIPEWKLVSPGSVEPWLVEVAILQESADEKATIACLRLAVRKFEDDLTVRSQLADVYYNQGKLAEAKRIYLGLYENSDDISTQLRWIQQLARLAREEGRMDQLIAEFKERRRTNRQSVAPLMALSEIYRYNREYEERRKVLLEASRLKPRDVDFILEIARIEESEGDWEAALKSLARAKAIKDSPKITERIAGIHLKWGDEDNGYRLLEELASSLSDADSIVGFAQSLAGRKDWERLIRFLAPQLEQFPDDYRIHFLDAIAREELSQIGAAKDAFLRMLTIKKELPRNKQAIKPRNTTDSHLPKNSNLYLNYISQMSSAYNYRRSRSNHYYSSFGGYRRPYHTSVTLPIDLEYSRAFAIVHLNELRSFMDEKDWQQCVESVIATVGRDYALLFDIDFDQRNDEVEIPLEVLDAEPDNLGLLTLWLTYQDKDTDSIDRLRKSFETFKQDYLFLAVSAGVQAVQLDIEKGREIYDLAVSLVAEIEKPTNTAIESIFNLIEPREAEDLELTGAQEELLRNKLTELYAKMDPTKNPSLPRLFGHLASSFILDDNPQGFVQFLEDRIAKGESNRQTRGYYSGRGDLIRPVSFPPQSIDGFPEEIRILLKSENERFYSWRYYGEVPSIDKYKEYYAIAQHPILKLLFGLRAEVDRGELETLINSFSKSEYFNELTIAEIKAGFYASEGQDKKVIEILEKVRYHSKPRDLRTKLDGARVFSAVRIDSTLEENRQAIEFGKSAALRLGYNRLQKKSLQELVSAMAGLGMEEAAEKQEDKINVSPASKRYTSSVAGDEDRLNRFIASGNTDMAVKELSMRLALLGRSLLDGRQSASSYRYRNFRIELFSYRLTNQVLEYLEKQADKSPQKRLDYIGALMVFGDDEAAHSQLKQAIDSNSRLGSDQFLLMMVANLIVTDVESAKPYLTGLDAEQVRNIATSSITKLRRREFDSFEEFSEPVLCLINLVDRMDERAANNWQWTGQLLRTIQSGLTIGDVYYRDLYVDQESESDQLGKDEDQAKKAAKLKAEEINKARWALHHQLLAELEKIPELSALVFEAQYANSVALELPFDKFERARETIDIISGLKRFPVFTQQSIHGQDLATCDELLVIEAYNNQVERDVFVEQTEARLKGTRHGSSILRRIKLLVSLYYGDSSEMVRGYRKLNDNPSAIIGSDIFHVFGRMAKERELSGDQMAEFLLEPKLIKVSGYPDEQYLPIMLKIGEASKKSLEKFLNQYIETFCGKPNDLKRSAKLEAMMDQLGYVIDEILTNEPSYFPVISRVIERQKLSDLDLYLLSDSMIYENADSFFECLGESALLAIEAKNFRSFDFLSDESGFSSVAYSINSECDTRTRIEIIERLELMNGFGAQLLVHFVEKDYDAAYTLLSKHFSELKPNEDEIVGLDQDWLSKLSEPEAPDKDELSIWLANKNSAQSSKQYEEFTGAKRLRDLKEVDGFYGLCDRTAKLMASAESSSKAIDIYRNGLEIALTERKFQSNRRYNWLLEETMLGTFANYGSENSLDEIDIVLEIIANEEVNLSINCDIFFGVCHSIYHQLLLEGIDAANFDTLFSSLWEIVGGDEQKKILLGLSLIEVTRVIYRRSKDISPFISWVEDNRTGKSYSELIEYVAMGLRLNSKHLGKLLDRDLGGFEQPNSFIDFYEKLYFHPSMTRQLRIVLAGSLFARASGVWSSKMVKSATKELIGALGDDEDIPLTISVTPILNQFCELPVDQEWKIIATSLFPAWKFRNRHFTSSNHYLYYNPNSRSISSVFQVLAKLGDETSLSSFTTLHRSGLDSYGSIVMLLRYGWEDRALAMLNRGRSNLRYDHFSSYHADIDKVLPSFLGKIKDPSLRYKAELGIAIAPDKQWQLKIGQSTPSPRDIRVEKVAKKFTSANLSGSTWATVLSQLVEYEEAIPHLKEPLQLSYSQLNYRRMKAVSDLSMASNMLNFPSLYCVEELRQGNAKPSIELWTKLLSEDELSSNIRYRLSSFFSSAHPFKGDWVELGPDNLAPYIEWLHVLIEEAQASQNSDFGFAVSNYVLISCLLDEEAYARELKWINSFSKADRDELSRLAGRGILQSVYGALQTTGKEVKIGDRYNLIKRTLKHPLIMSGKLNRHTLMDNCINSFEMFSVDAIEPYFKDYVSSSAQGGIAALDVTNVFIKEKNFEQASEFLKLAKQQVSISEQDNSEIRTAILLSEADLLAKQGDQPAAIVVANQIDAMELHIDYQERYMLLCRELKIKRKAFKKLKPSK